MMAHGCTYCTDDFHCEKFTDEKYTSWCYGKDYPCKDRRISNADRIRAMTDEELAEWFIKVQDDVADYYDGGHAFAPELPTMENSWLDWLKQEAKE